MSKIGMKKFVKNEAKKGANLFECMFVHDEKEKIMAIGRRGMMKKMATSCLNLPTWILV